ncbi:AMP-binding protein [Halomicronema sp. CCY15110]|uniref:AMP-binding protein n=1 Tax=Halomicronema sp. CCY15110 TaxID=2767773 RepID=UPI00194DEE75|nr:AMP-binding protein [Halomicronema sp. CCY15110]
MTPAESLQRRWGEPWLVGMGAATFWDQLEQFQTQLQAEAPRNVLLAEPDPVRFLAAFFAALQSPCRLWLANPQWGTQEWSQVMAQCPADMVLGTASIAEKLQTPNGISPTSPTSPTSLTSSTSPTPPPCHPIPLPPHHSSPAILIPTGGSSGNIQFATHTWDTLTASVQGFCQHFDCATVNAYCVLPLYHVSGLMQALRCWVSGGRLTLQPFRELLQAGAIAPTAAPSFLSLVPTQLQRLLSSDLDFLPWLRSCSAILLGGAPPWPALLQTARDLRLPLAPTYGMTETASQVATLLPQEFLAGQTGSGRALPHARLTIHDEAGNALPPNQPGHIMIAAKSLALARGLDAIAPPWRTGDLGYLDAAGYLHVVGRQQTLIMTGGEKVLPEEVEAAILATGWVRDVAILGVPDADWGEAVVAIIAHPETESNVSDRLGHILRGQLSPYKIPKHWLYCPSLPRHAQGKLNRAALRQWVLAQLSPTAATSESTPALGDDADG